MIVVGVAVRVVPRLYLAGPPGGGNGVVLPVLSIRQTVKATTMLSAGFSRWCLVAKPRYIQRENGEANQLSVCFSGGRQRRVPSPDSLLSQPDVVSFTAAYREA